MNFGPRGEFPFPQEISMEDSTLAPTVTVLATNPVSITAVDGQTSKIYSLMKREIHSLEVCYFLTKTVVTRRVVLCFIKDVLTTTLSLRNLISTSKKLYQ